MPPCAMQLGHANRHRSSDSASCSPPRRPSVTPVAERLLPCNVVAPASLAEAIPTILRSSERAATSRQPACTTPPAPLATSWLAGGTADSSAPDVTGDTSNGGLQKLDDFLAVDLDDCTIIRLALMAHLSRTNTLTMTHHSIPHRCAMKAANAALLTFGTMMITLMSE